MTNDKPVKIETDNSSANERRRLIKHLAAGGGIVGTAAALPQQWMKPVVDSVVLPAHAQTSVVEDSSPGVNFTVACQSVGPNVGTSTAPGPDIDISPPTVLQAQLAVSPAPGAGATATLRQFRNNMLISTTTPDVSTGVTNFMIGAGSVGTFEARYTFQGQTCSIHWTCVDI